MTWKERLLPGSFRGAEFGIESHGLTGGRRVRQHQYPGRDRPYAEDLGRRARTFKIEAWIVGADYDRDRDALIAACEAPGEGRLIHPYLGTRSVSCDPYETKERTDEGRMCRFTMTFHESGRRATPSNTPDRQAALSGAMAPANSALTNRFESDFGP